MTNGKLYFYIQTDVNIGSTGFTELLHGLFLWVFAKNFVIYNGPQEQVPRDNVR